MIARIQKAVAKKDQGFTLIELLVVVIIIGILAAIAIPVFLNQRQGAVDAGVKSDLRTIANEVETYYVNNQKYPATGEVAKVTGAAKSVKVGTGTNDKTVSLSNENTTVTYTAADGGYKIVAKNTADGTGKEFTYDSKAGGLQG